MEIRSGTVVGIAGAGLIGASIGLRSVQLGLTVVAWDTVEEHARRAVERCAAHRTANSLAELAAGCDVLVLAAPPGATLALLSELACLPLKARLVIDVASVKVPIAKRAAGLAGFVGTHPIAGSERSGPDAARADLFCERVWTYDAAAAPAPAALARAFIATMGARAHAVTNDEHDRIVAATSHLPQLLSVALGVRVSAALAQHDAAPLCGTGVRGMLRLSDSSWDLWHSILSQNAAPVAQEVRRLVDVLTSVATHLEEGRTAALEERFTAAASAFARLGTPAATAGTLEPNAGPSDER